MTIRALFFATHREIAGTDEMVVELADAASVADLVRELRARGAPWERFPASPAVAVNQSYAPLSTELRHGDEVAFIPPVAGG